MRLCKFPVCVILILLSACNSFEQPSSTQNNVQDIHNGDAIKPLISNIEDTSSQMAYNSNTPQNTQGDATSNLTTSIYEVECALVGYWHESPGIAAGYGERYVFFTDYSFKYYANEMDGMEKTREYSGKWSIRDDDLYLEILQKRVVVGGEAMPSSGSIATEEEIIGGILTTIEFLEPEIEILKIGVVEIDENFILDPENNQYAFKRKINEKYFWKFINMD